MTHLVLADNHRVVRASLRDLLEREPEFRVAAEADGGGEAVRLARDLRPDVVLMDITMPDLNGIEATRLIVAADPKVKVIALSVHADWHTVAAAFMAGAAGYLIKNDAGKELPEAIRAVMAGGRYASRRFRDPPGPGKPDASGTGAAATVASLSAGDLATLRLLTEGWTPGEIDRSLGPGGRPFRPRVERIISTLSLLLLADDAPPAIYAAEVETTDGEPPAAGRKTSGWDG